MHIYIYIERERERHMFMNDGMNLFAMSALQFRNPNPNSISSIISKAYSQNTRVHPAKP